MAVPCELPNGPLSSSHKSSAFSSIITWVVMWVKYLTYFILKYPLILSVEIEYTVHIILHKVESVQYCFLSGLKYAEILCGMGVRIECVSCN